MLMTVFQKRRMFLKNCYDGRITDSFDSTNFSEYTMKRGGDTCVFRVYGDNEQDMMITQR